MEIGDNEFNPTYFCCSQCDAINYKILIVLIHLYMSKRTIQIIKKKKNASFYNTFRNFGYFLKCLSSKSNFYLFSVLTIDVFAICNLQLKRRKNYLKIIKKSFSKTLHANK